jgi:hypothetical protein
MMQETGTIGPTNPISGDMISGQGLLTLLALVGTKRMDTDTLRARMKLTPHAFRGLLSWLQREYLVDIISSLEGDHVEERVVLTEKGEEALVGMLEKTCELPDFR